MTDIVIFPKIFQRNFLGRCGGTAALLTGLGGEVGWALRPKQPLEVGTNLYQKPTPKQDKGGGINPPPNSLAVARSQHAGNPRLETETPKEIWTEI